jgi:hypothetical protein
MEARHRFGGKTGAAAAFSDELAALVVGGVLHQGGKQGWTQT